MLLPFKTKFPINFAFFTSFNGLVYAAKGPAGATGAIGSDLSGTTGSESSSATSALGRLDVNGPLPPDFAALFAQSVKKAINSSTNSNNNNSSNNNNNLCSGISLLETNVLDNNNNSDTNSNNNPNPSQNNNNNIVELVFRGSPRCISEVERQASDANSSLILDTPMYSFLVSENNEDDEGNDDSSLGSGSGSVGSGQSQSQSDNNTDNNTGSESSSSTDLDSELPFGSIQPFGREDTAQELTESSIKESDTMIDQIERAQVAEEKRAVFRALTRLRGAAIASFDGVATSQTGNIDGYARTHRWRASHPLHHLANQEGDVGEWAFPG